MGAAAAAAEALNKKRSVSSFSMIIKTRARISKYDTVYPWETAEKKKAEVHEGLDDRLRRSRQFNNASFFFRPSSLPAAYT